MSKAVLTKEKLQNNPLLQEAYKLTEHIYDRLRDFPEEERWATMYKLRSSANELLFMVSQAVGNASPTGAEYDWGLARKYGLALRTMYTFAGKRHFIELEPKIVVRLDKLIEQISSEVQQAYKQTERENEESLEHWRKKYKLSRKADV